MKKNKIKYYHIAISSGKHPEELNEAIRFYLNENSILSEDNEE